MSRSRWKLNFFNSYIYKNIYYLKVKKLKKKKKIIFNKASIIPYLYSSNSILVYKGNLFKKLKINKFLVGLRFGVFTITRKPFYFPDNKKKSGKR
jgi:ribosomal protein S19